MSHEGLPRGLLLAAVLIVVAQIAYVAAYRVYLGPLAKVPGPKLAALTHLYEFYYDAIHLGKFAFKVDDLHQQYGPVVRINPREVHIMDPDFFEQLYGGSRKLNKDAYFYRFVGTLDSSFGTSSFAIHRQRRKAYSRFFSPAAIQDLEADVRGRVLRLCARLEEYRGTGKPVILGSCFRALATDVVSGHALPQGFNLVDSNDFGADYNNVNRKISSLTTYNRHFPFVIPLALSIPTWLVKMTATSGMVQMLDFQAHNRAQAQAIADSPTPSKSNTSILHGISTSDLPASDKTAARMFQEALTFVGAGSETTGSALEHTVYHVLANSSIHARLSAELRAAATDNEGSDIPPYVTLRHLPYLNACIKEALRLGNHVSGRLPRIDPTDPIIYTCKSAGDATTYTFPPGTVVSMSLRDVHLSPEVYMEPLTFDPERFLGPEQSKPGQQQQQQQQKRDEGAGGGERGRDREKYFAPFGLGSRSCVGRDLAMLEVRIAVAAVMLLLDGRWNRRKVEGEERGEDEGGGLELYQTSYEDIELAHELFSPFQREGSQGLRVLLT